MFHLFTLYFPLNFFFNQLIGSVDDRWVHLGMFVEIISLLLIELIAHRVKPYHSFLVFDFPECWTAQESFTYHLLKMNLSVLEKAEGLVYREGSNAELYKSFIHILNAFFTASLWILSRGKVEAHKIATLAKNVCHLCHQLNDPQATKYAEKISFEYGQLDVIIERYYVGDTFKFEEFMVHVQKTQRLDLVQEMARTFIRRGAIHLLFAFNDESYHAQIELALKDNPQVGILWFLNKQKYDRAYSLALENLHNKQTPQEFKTFADLAKVAFFSNPKGGVFQMQDLEHDLWNCVSSYVHEKFDPIHAHESDVFSILGQQVLTVEVASIFALAYTYQPTDQPPSEVAEQLRQRLSITPSSDGRGSLLDQGFHSCRLSLVA
eukprot:TRINITY_DN1650_c0_g1_i3.p1 TRINITY_DN1650_c0_g1~~TRINITY_DN1650_c0_g1_i3.p1  ORF type:complete len:378 (-),score=61.33 TRINITY_DN1650_c0_g1_i3:279-1412(-)